MQNVNLVREYVKNNFTDKGMCADFAIHDNKNGNPHAHIMLTMRPFNEDKTWGDKQKKVYEFDKDGNKIYDPKKRQYKCSKVQTTDWNEQSKAEEWRAAWATTTNKYLEMANHAERIDHRSYERQGIDQIPTIHLGVAAHQMEKRGIRTERGDINRAIEISNRKLRQLADQINELQGWLAEERANPEQSIAMPQSELEHLKVIYPQQEQIIMVDDHEQLTDHSPVFAKHVAENSIHKPSAPRTTEPYQPTFTEIISDILSRQGQSVVDAKTTTQILNFLESNDIADYDGLVTHMQNLMGQQRETSHKYSTIRKRQNSTFSKYL